MNQNQKNAHHNYSKLIPVAVAIAALVTMLVVGVLVGKAQSEASYYKECFQRLELATGEHIEDESDFEAIWESRIQQAEQARRSCFMIYRLHDEKFRANAVDGQVPLKANTTYVVEMDLSNSKYADNFSGIVELKYPKTLSAGEIDRITVSGIDKDGDGFDGVIYITTKNSHIALSQELVEGYNSEIRDGKFYAVICTKETVTPNTPDISRPKNKSNEL